MAQRLAIDSLWVRLAFLVGLLFFGMTFFIYLALWFLVPKESTKQKPIDVNTSTQKLTLSQDDSMIA
ncbi:MAG: PspC domain-containing protein [Patescibacteria group bacterium]